MYIGANSAATSSKTALFIVSETKTADYVWVVDTNDKTIVSKAITDRGIATQVDSTYSNFSTYATSNFTDVKYKAAWFEI